MVAIAGNHDDPDRLDARAVLATFAHVHLLGRPRRASEGGTLTLETRSRETAIIAALPFATVGTWISALDLVGDEALARQKYARMFQKAVESLCHPFRPDAVNLLVAHTNLHGAAWGSSERRIHISEDWTALPDALPSSASYIALGHIHQPQQIAGHLPAYYAGSPMQMDFAEVGQRKTFGLVTAEPGKPARVEHISYEGALPLLDLRGTLDELAALRETHRDGAWLRVTAVIPQEDPDLNRKVRELFPRALVVRPALPEASARPIEASAAGASPAERYAAFHTAEHGAAPDAELLAAFNALHTAEDQRVA
jgi:exonuclease SbcD